MKVDGDIVLSTDNKYFINGAHKDQSIITYEKGIAKKEKISSQNFVKKDLMGFGTAVGSFSNTATILYAMIGIFKDGDAQRDELYGRIKLLREYVGQEIDRAKLGIKQPKLPKEWREFLKIEESDTKEQRDKKYYHNSMVISKKPYFFRYLYPELNEKFKKYEKAYDIISKDKFGMKFKDLLLKQNKTQEEMNIVRRYQKFSPLIVSNCSMNILCKSFENMELDIKFDKNARCLLPKYEDEFEIEIERLEVVRNLYRMYNSKKGIKEISFIFDDKDSEELMEARINEMDYIRDKVREELSKYSISNKEFLYYSWKLSYIYSSYNWGFTWDILGDDIIDLIEEGQTVIPIRDPDGSDYLGCKYSLSMIEKEDELW